LGLAASVSAGAAEQRPDDFAYAMPIKTAGAGTAYRITVPVEVFTKVVQEDLRDIRVFNANGTVVPYELRAASPEPAATRQGPSLPLYALHGDARATLNGVRVTIHSAGAAVDLQPASPANPQVVTSYVLDARELAQALSGLQLHWAQDAPEFSGSLRIESSDDLASWHRVRSDAPVVHLVTPSATLIQNLLEFPDTKASFWRLTWVGKPAPFELTSATARMAAQQPVLPRSGTAATGDPVTSKEDELSFDLGARLPVTEVNLLLPESNSVRRIELFSRASPTDSWHRVIVGDFYRVANSASEHANAPMRIALNPDRYWLARQIQPASAIGHLQLQVAWDAMEVVFLAQGPGPYLLAYGNGSAPSSSVALDPLLKGVSQVEAATGPPYAIGGPGRLRLPPKTLPWRMTVLWLALGFAVVLLGWMAYRLSREVARDGGHGR
jgi:hypothetical protein